MSHEQNSKGQDMFCLILDLIYFLYKTIKIVCYDPRKNVEKKLNLKFSGIEYCTLIMILPGF